MSRTAVPRNLPMARLPINHRPPSRGFPLSAVLSVPMASGTFRPALPSPPSLRLTPQGQEHQEGWAKHLGTPVEMTNAIGMKLCSFHQASSRMGEGGDAHRVTVTKAFYLGKCEVNAGGVGEGSCRHPSTFKGPKNPVEMLNGRIARTFWGSSVRNVVLPEESLPSAHKSAVG